jgi:hypothetical protein
MNWRIVYLRDGGSASSFLGEKSQEARELWNAVAMGLRAALRKAAKPPHVQRKLAERPYEVFLYWPPGEGTRVCCVERNPEKEGLARPKYRFESPLNDWPFHKE